MAYIEMLGFMHIMHERNPPLCTSNFVGMLCSVISGRLILQEAAKVDAEIIPVAKLLSSSSSSSINADTDGNVADACGASVGGDGSSSGSMTTSSVSRTWG